MYGPCALPQFGRSKVNNLDKVNPSDDFPPARIPKIEYAYYENLSKPRPKYRNNVAKPRGVHDYYNVAYDPHVIRGKTFKTFSEVERSRVQRTKYVRRRHRPNFYAPVEIPKTPPPATVEKYVVNLDRFLVETVTKPLLIENGQQTDDLHRKKVPKPVIVPKIGFDKSTDILPDELLTFEEEAKPIATTVGEKILEQALRESMEEEELEALRAEQREYEERRRLEALRLTRLEKRCREYLKKSGHLMKCRQLRHCKEKDTERRVGARMFSQSYFTLLIPQLLEGLKDEGFFESVDEKCLKRNFTPWINHAVETELCQQLLVGGVLDRMLENLCVTRETEYAIGRLKEAGDAEIPGEGHDP